MSSKISKISPISPTYIIAEIGFNHMGKFGLAKKMVYAAKKTGVDAVKFQTFVPEEMVFKSSKHFKLIKNTNLKTNDYYKLKKIAHKLGLDFFSTSFDLESFKILKKINIDCLKIASMDLDNFQMFSYLKNFKKPIILSTGMSSINEIKKSYKYLNKTKKNIFLLHCISNYPTNDDVVSLGFLNKLNSISNWKVGYSDHTLGIESAKIAVAMGSKIIEKHFTIDNKLEGADNKNSLNTSKMKKFVNEIRLTEKMIKTFTNNIFRPDINQKTNFRRFIFARNDINKGEKISDSKIICLRSNKKNLVGVGNYLKIVNKITKKNIKNGSPILFKDLK